jgi:very-short-patch-repair endonuclease
VDSQVGFSGYRIDLAVVDPKDDSRYVIGIECDGATFHSAKSARERDVGRQKFLEDRGWTIERVWSRNWWRDRQGEIARLERRIGELSKARKSDGTLRTAACCCP